MWATSHPLMTCSECSNPILVGSAICRHCGAPSDEPNPSASPAPSSPSVVTSWASAQWNAAPDSEAGSSSITTSSTGLRLWNPYLVAILTVPVLGHLIASTLIALNWHQLRRVKLALCVLAFEALFFAVGDVLLILVLSAVAPSLGTAWVLNYAPTLLVWFPLVVLPQIIYLHRNAPKTYTRRRWVLPIALGLGLGIGLALTPNKPLARMQELFLGYIQRALTENTESVEYNAEQLVARVKPLVLEFRVTWRNPAPLAAGPSESTASAVAIRAEGTSYFFVTNRHAVQVPLGAQSVAFEIGKEGERIPVEVIALAKNGMDLALLRATYSAVPESRIFVTVTSVQKIAVGQQCLAIGNALGAGESVTSGIVSRLDNIDGKIYIRTSAPISPGNSGGGLFSLKGGFLLGITTASIAGNAVQNVNFAIPTEYFMSDDAWEYLSYRKP